MILSSEALARNADQIPPKESQFDAPSRVYPFDQLNKEFKNALEQAGLSQQAVEKCELKKSPSKTGYDYGFACHFIEDVVPVSATEIAKKLAMLLNATIRPEGMILSYGAVGPYVNLQINYDVYGPAVINNVKEMGNKYGSENIGQGTQETIDSSSPNAAKLAHVGHLRSTIWGDAIAKIRRHIGFTVIKDNHLGDWGTGFGHLLNALGSLENLNKINSDHVTQLQQLYIDITAKGRLDPDIVDQGRAWFLKLEQGDPEAKAMWEKIVAWSIKELQEIYDVLDVNFDTWKGESYYENQLEATVQLLNFAGITQISDGALIVDLKSEDNNVAIVVTSDGRSQYITRDLATYIHHIEETGSQNVIYVVGSEQKPVFRQLFSILEKVGYPAISQGRATHVDFGMMLLPNGEKMSTREGTAVPLKQLIEDALRQAAEIVLEKSRLPEKERLQDAINGSERWFDIVRQRDEEIFMLVKQIAMGALKWNDLKQSPVYPVTFDMDRMMSLKGDSALYVQYEYARAFSVSENQPSSDTVQPTHELEKELIKILTEFPEIIRRAGLEYNPSLITTVVHRLAKAYNKFYIELKILSDDEIERTTRLNITKSVMIALKTGLNLLGIDAPNRI